MRKGESMGIYVSDKTASSAPPQLIRVVHEDLDRKRNSCAQVQTLLAGRRRDAFASSDTRCMNTGLGNGNVLKDRAHCIVG